MMLPPALTWSCLFPSGVSPLCDSAPSWFAKLLQVLPRGGNPVRISFDAAAPFIPDPDDVAGHVLINPRGIREMDLRRGGYPYVRRFAVLPSLARARWFIPLDAPAISSAGFRLYTPARRSARLKRFVAQLATRTRLPMWYRDSLILASRTLPPIEKVAHDLFPGIPIRLAISAGAPEPARNRKPSFAVLDMAGAMLAIGKIATTPLSQRIVRHESDVLRALAQTSLNSRVPRLLFAQELEENFVAIQSPLPGAPAAASFTAAHAAFLGSLRQGPAVTAASTAMIRALPLRLAELSATSPATPRLQYIFDSLYPTLAQMTVPSTIVHGDFTPWNLRHHHGAVSAFDWEYAELDGLPLLDETHFRLQVGYLLDHWQVARARRCLADMSANSPLGLSPEQVRTLEAIYLLDSLVRLLAEGYDPNDDMISWYHELLLGMMPAEGRAAVA